MFASFFEKIKQERRFWNAATEIRVFVVAPSILSLISRHWKVDLEWLSMRMKHSTNLGDTELKRFLKRQVSLIANLMLKASKLILLFQSVALGNETISRVQLRKHVSRLRRFKISSPVLFFQEKLANIIYAWIFYTINFKCQRKITESFMNLYWLFLI